MTSSVKLWRLARCQRRQHPPSAVTDIPLGDVLHLLADQTKRFTELKNEIDGISQRTLTVTLRGLERDGIVSRTVNPVVPPWVDYTLTELGQSLSATINNLVDWAERSRPLIDTARSDYDIAVLRAQRSDRI